MTQTDAILAIDGGGSGCRAVLRRAGQPDLRAETTAPANAYSDPGGAAATIADLATGLAAQAGIALPPVTAGVAGCRLPALAQNLADHLPFPARIVDDSVTAALGALGARDGIVVGLGTGSFFLRKTGLETRAIGGWGFTLGDRASGAWIGRAAVAAALRAADGLTPADALTEALREPHPLLRFHHASPADFAALAPTVLAHADTATGRHLIAAAVAEVELAIATLGSRAADPIVMTGGFATAIAEHLPPALQGRLSAPAGSPLDGALALAEGAPLP